MGVLENQNRYQSSNKGKKKIRDWYASRTPDQVAARTEYMRAFREERLTFLNDLKIWCGCADCGYRNHPEALDFDHLPGFTKKCAIAVIRYGRMEVLLDELSKCEVVCSNCHRVRTSQRRTNALD
jgi:hypothetical protein